MSRSKTQNPTRPPKKRLATPPQLTPIDDADVDAAFDVIRMESEPAVSAGRADVLIDVDADAAAAAAAIADLSMDDDIPIEVSGADFAPDLADLAVVKKADSPTRRARTQPIEAALEDVPVKRGPPKPPPKKSDTATKPDASVSAPRAKSEVGQLDAKAGSGIPSILSRVKAAEKATGSVAESVPARSAPAPSLVESSTTASTRPPTAAPTKPPTAASTMPSTATSTAASTRSPTAASPGASTAAGSLGSSTAASPPSSTMGSPTSSPTASLAAASSPTAETTTSAGSSTSSIPSGSQPLVAPSTGGAAIGRISTPRTTPPKPPPRPATSTRPPPPPTSTPPGSASTTPSVERARSNASGPATRAETVAGTPVGGVPLRLPLEAPPTIVTPNPLASLGEALESSRDERWPDDPPPLARADSVLDLVDAKRDSDSEMGGGRAFPRGESEVSDARAYVPPRRAKRATSQRDYDVEDDDAMTSADLAAKLRENDQAPPRPPSEMEPEGKSPYGEPPAPRANERPASYLEYALRAGLPRKVETEVPTAVREPSADSEFDFQPVPTKILDAALDFPDEQSAIDIKPVPAKALDAALSFDGRSELDIQPVSTKAPERRSDFDIQPVPTKVLDAALRFDSEPSMKGPVPTASAETPSTKGAARANAPKPAVPAPAPNTKVPAPNTKVPAATTKPAAAPTAKVPSAPTAKAPVPLPKPTSAGAPVPLPKPTSAGASASVKAAPPTTPTRPPGKAALPPPRPELAVPRLALRDSSPSIGKVDTKILEHAIRPESEPAITVSRAESEFDYSSLALDNDASGRMPMEQAPRANSALERALHDSVDVALDDESGDFGPAIAPLRTMQLAERGPSISDALERDDTAILQLGVFEHGGHLQSASSAIIGAGHAITVGTSEREGLEQIGIAMTDGHLDAILVGLPGGEVLIKAALSMAPWGPIVIAACSGKADEAARQANAAGADLVAIRPHDPERLGPVLLAAARILEQRRDLMAAQQGRQEDLLSRLGSDAESDEVGGLLSFDAFQRALELELKRVRRYQYALSLGLFALDIASTQPPPAGIKGILRARAGNALLHSIRDIDMATELDQERFLVLLPYTDLTGATEVARRIISAVRAIPPVVASGGEFQPTLVGAIAGAKPGQQLSFNKLIRDAQRALEAALRDGAELAVQP
ncbi:MAG: diguanylate cyclase domain-containing protein [Kofleriaceae bacterium]